MTMKLDIYGLATTERMYAYSQSMQIMGQCGCIGYLRGDFGHGEEFYTTWFDHRAEHKTDEFKAEFDKVVNALRAEDGCGLFASRDSMGRFCRDHADVAFAGNSCTEYGFKLKTMEHTYLLRCNPNHGDYNFYLYAYVSRHLEHHMEQAKRGIRFITPEYKELFRIPDGDIKLTADGGTAPYLHGEDTRSIASIQFAPELLKQAAAAAPAKEELDYILLTEEELEELILKQHGGKSA